MKLYATITSERASKGQGGNERLDIQISLDGGETQGGVIAVREIEGVYTIVYFYNGEAHKVNQIESKGERQKGEGVCVHNIRTWNCPQCNRTEFMSIHKRNCTERSDCICDYECHQAKGERQKGERANHHSCAGCRAGIPH